MKIFEIIEKDPIKLSQLVSSILFGISSVCILLGWLWGADKDSMQIPLIIMGISVVYLLVTSVKAGFALAISLLVVGTIVTTEDFIIKISHLVKQGGKIESYLSTKPHINQLSPKQEAKLTAEKLIAELGTNGDGKFNVESIERVLKERDLEKLVNKVGKSRTLAELYLNPSKWKKLVEKWKDDDEFKNDISKARNLNIIACPENDPYKCSLTKLGKQVAIIAKEKDRLFDLSIFSEADE